MALSLRIGLTVQLIKLTKAVKQIHDSPAQNGTSKKAKKTEPKSVCIDYQLDKTRMAAVHKITFFAMRIELMRSPSL